MKTHTYLLACSLVAFSFTLEAHEEGEKENVESSAKTEILEIVDTENFDTDVCVACPVPVQIFDQKFNLILTGEMTPMQETNSQILRVLIGQSNLIMESSAAIIYQLEE